MTSTTFYLNSDGFLSFSPENAECWVTVEADPFTDYRSFFSTVTKANNMELYIPTRMSVESFKRRISNLFNQVLIFYYPNRQDNVATHGTRPLTASS